MNDIKVPPFTEGQKELIKMTEKLASSRKICDVDDIDDDIKDIKEIILETIAKIETKTQTNFQRITKSPEALAEFICQAFYQVDGRYNSFQQDIEDEYCYERNHYEYGDREQVIFDWLNEESEE